MRGSRISRGGVDRRTRARRMRQLRQRVAVLLSAAALLTVLVVGVKLAGAFGSQFFELDGNAADGSLALPDDWATTPGGSISRTFVIDTVGAGDGIFTGGGSKDESDLTDWRWTSGTAPDKDDLAHAYARDYLDTKGTADVTDDELLLFFGADRYATNGSANLGFWFLRSAAGPDPDGTFGSAVHAEGDIFVASEFTNGGSVPVIRIYEWQAGALVLVGENASNATCNAADSVCAVVNSTDQPAPWPYTPKSGTADTFGPGAFFEGGINLTKLFGADIPCVSSFLASTRTSFETSSQLKDFAMGSLDICGKIVVEKKTVPAGSAETFSFTGDLVATLGNGGTAEKEVQRGVYTVTEAAEAGWTLASLACDDADSTVSLATGVATFRVSPGETVTCTYVNEGQPTLTLVKTVVNDDGGTATPGDWPLSATGPTSISGLSGTAAVTGRVVTAGAYTLAEGAGPSGYEAGSWSCTDGTLAGAVLTLANGQSATCTIVNDDVAPRLVVIKEVVNDEGGTAVPADFTMNVTATGPSSASFPGAGAPGTEITLDAGAYSVDEAAAAGYVKTLGAGCAGVIAIGETRRCTITNDDDLAPTVTITKTPSPATLPEPGGEFTFTLVVRNTSLEAVTVTSLTDQVGAVVTSLAGKGTCAVGTVLAPGATTTCSFTTTFTGNAGETQADTARVVVTDAAGDTASAEASATVRLTGVPSTVRLVKTAGTTSVQEPGGPVTFTFAVSNPLQFVVDGVTVTSVDSITVSTLVDSVFGDITAECGLAGTVLDPGESAVCQIVRSVTGTAAAPHLNVATVTATDDDDATLTASDDATVEFTPAPPTPPTPPAEPTPPAPPTIDVAAQKTATPQLTLDTATRTATITYALAFVNNGPGAATAVVASDPAPAGVTFLAVTQQPAQGSCAVTAGGTAVDCALGTLQPGQSLTATVTARVGGTGTFTNVVTVVGEGGPDTSPANNTAQASTLVVAPLAPPTAVAKPAAKPKPTAKPEPKAAKPKPKPEPKPAAKPKPVDVCDTLSVAQKTLRGDGSRQVVAAVVREGRKAVRGARVLITGPGIRIEAVTRADGTVRIPVKPRTSSILRVEIKGSKACNTKRIGVVAVFEPPVTG